MYPFILSKNRNLIPKNSNPTIINHEPGVSGVIKAKKPAKIKSIPKIFFNIILLIINIISQ